MATLTSLGFNIFSRYDGDGINRAHRAISGLQDQLRRLNGQSQTTGNGMIRFGNIIRRETNALNSWSGRLMLATKALIAIGPALIPISAAVAKAGASFGAMAITVSSAVGIYVAAMKGAIDRALEAAAAHEDLFEHEKPFVKAYKNMTKAWEGFIRATAPKTLQAATEVVKGLTAGIGKLKPVVDAMHPAVMKVAKAFRSWMERDNGFQRFIDIVIKHGVPAFDKLATAGRNVLKALGIGFRAFVPEIGGMSDAIVKLSEKFKNWAEGGGFERFLKYVKDNGPEIREFFNALGGAISTLWKAFQILAPLSLAFVTLILKFVAAVPPEVIAAIAAGFVVLSTAIGALGKIIAPIAAAVGKLVAEEGFAGLARVMGSAARVGGALVIVAAAIAENWDVVVGVAKRLWEQIQKHLVPAFKSLWDNLQEAWKNIQPFVELLGNILRPVLIAIGFILTEVLIPALAGLVRGIGEVLTWITKAIGWFGEFGNFIIENFVPIMRDIWSGIRAAWDAAWAGISTAVRAVWTALQVAWNGFIGGIQTAWTAVSAAFSTAWTATWNSVHTTAQTVWTAMQTGWNSFVGFFQSLWTTVSAAFSAAWTATWNSVRTVAQAIWTAMQAAWTAFINTLQSIWTSVSAALSSAWNAVWNALSSAARAIWSAMQAAWNAVVIAFQTIWNTVSSALSSAWSAFWNALSSAAQAVWSALQTAWQTFFNVLTNIWSAFSNAIGAAWQTFWNVLTNAWSTFSNAIGAAWQTFFNVLTNIWSTFSNAIGAAWQTFFNVLTNIWSTFSNAFGTAWQTFYNVLTNIWSTFSNAFGTAWQTFYNVLTTIWSTFSNAFGVAWQTFYNVLTTIWSTFSNAIGTAWDTFFRVLTTIWSAFSNAIGTAWDTFFNVLTNIWNDFKDAFQKAWEASWNTVRDTAQKIWDGIVKVVEGAINAILKPVNLLIKGFNAIGNVFGLKDIPEIKVNFAYGGIVGAPKGFSEGGVLNFAHGGAVPGYSPGNDRVPAMLSPGEGVLVPEAVKGLGGPGFVHSANYHFSKGRAPRKGGPSWHGGNADGHFGFAEGGVAPGQVQPMAMGGITLAAMRRQGIPTSAITQPEYNTGVAASAGTHDRGGVVDFRPDPALLKKLLANGWAAWMRTPAQGFSPHIHAILMSHPDIAPAARAQVADFMKGGDGLGVGGGGGGGGIGDIFGSLFDNIKGIIRDIVELKPVQDVLGALGGIFGAVTNEDDSSGLFGSGIGPDVGPDVVGGIAGAVDDVTGIGGDMMKSIMQMMYSMVTMADLDYGFGKRDDALKKAGVGTHWFGDLMKGGGKWLLDKAKQFIMDKKPESFDPMDFAGGFGTGVQQWAPLARIALARAGLNPNQLGAFLALMEAESGGNPLAINRTDINARNGVPSQGLMQVIPPTFAAYRDPALPNNILDPLANMTASARYIKARYGGRVPGSPYATGTNSATPGMHLVGERGPEMVAFGGGEKVFTASRTSSMLKSGGSGGDTKDPMDRVQGLVESAELVSQAVQQAFAAMSTASSGSWHAVLDQAKKIWTTVRGTVLADVNKAMTLDMPLWHETARADSLAKWTAIKNNLATTWTAMRTTSLADANKAMTLDMPLWHETMRLDSQTKWTAIKDNVAANWTNMRDTTFTDAQNYMVTQLPSWAESMRANTVLSFQNMRDGTGEAWSGLRTVTSEPVNWIITNVYGGGIKKLWDTVAQVIFGGSSKNLPAVSPIGAAAGGSINGRGSTTSDSIPAWLSRGEHVWTAREVRAAGGHQAVQRMRSSVLGGKPVRGEAGNTARAAAKFSVGGWLGNLGVGGTALGLNFDNLKELRRGELGTKANPILDQVKKGIDANIAKDASAYRGMMHWLGAESEDAIRDFIAEDDALTQYYAQWGLGGFGGGGAGGTVGSGARLAAAVSWARAQVGKPYSLGAFGSALDCSTFQSGIATMIRDGRASRWFTTHPFHGGGARPVAGWERNLNAPFMIGVTASGIGHMGGTLNGVNYEATPPRVRSGSAARGANHGMYTWRYGFRPSITASTGVSTAPAGGTGSPGSRPDDYTRTTYGGKTVNRRTARMLDAAASIYGSRWTITQGSYNRGVAASAGTHDGGGVVDTAQYSNNAVMALRRSGFASWARGPQDGMAYHAHSVAIGDREMSPAAASQVRSYFAGRNGLANNGPDRHGGPIGSNPGGSGAGFAIEIPPRPTGRTAAAMYMDKGISVKPPGYFAPGTVPTGSGGSIPAGGAGWAPAVFTSFWDSTTALGRGMTTDTIASSYLPLMSRVGVNIGGKTATGQILDLGPAKFVYDRHPGKAVLDLNEVMMQRLTGRRSNVVNGLWKLLSVGNGRTLYGTRLRGFGQGGAATDRMMPGYPVLGDGDHPVKFHGEAYHLGTPGGRRGWNLVGDRGPEWMKFRGGERVLPHGEFPDGTFSSNGVTVTFANGAIQIDLSRATEEAVDKFKSEALPEMRMMLQKKLGRRN